MTNSIVAAVTLSTRLNEIYLSPWGPAFVVGPAVSFHETTGLIDEAGEMQKIKSP